MITNVDSMNDSDPVNPINLRERFECRYKINHDPAYYSEYGRRARVDDPWLQIIPCHHGEIFPWGGDLLAASTSRRGAIANRLSELDCCEVKQDGSDGVTVTFHIDDFRKVADLIRPRGSRQLSPSRRRAFVKAGQSSRLSKQPGHNSVSDDKDTSSLPNSKSDSENSN